MGFAMICPDCRKKFPWSSKVQPEFCPYCGFRTASDRADDDVVMPSILTMRSKAIDQTYRAMEKGSEFRAEMAAELTGATVAEMSGLKITDLKSTHEGEIAAKEDPQAAARLSNVNPQNGTVIGPNFQGGSGGEAYGGNVASGAVVVNGEIKGTGQYPRRGSQILGTIQAGR